MSLELTVAKVEGNCLIVDAKFRDLIKGRKRKADLTEQLKEFLTPYEDLVDPQLILRFTNQNPSKHSTTRVFRQLRDRAEDLGWATYRKPRVPVKRH